MLKKGDTLSTEIEARRELSRYALVQKNQYEPQLVQFGLLDLLWQSLIKARHCRFQFNSWYQFLIQPGKMEDSPQWKKWSSSVYNWIPNAMENPRVNWTRKKPCYRGHVMHAIGWSLQLTITTLFLQLQSKTNYYGYTRIISYFDLGNVSPICELKDTLIWEINNHSQLSYEDRWQGWKIQFEMRTFFPLSHKKRNKHGTSPEGPHVHKQLMDYL